MNWALKKEYEMNKQMNSIWVYLDELMQEAFEDATEFQLDNTQRNFEIFCEYWNQKRKERDDRREYFRKYQQRRRELAKEIIESPDMTTNGKEVFLECL